MSQALFVFKLFHNMLIHIDIYNGLGFRMSFMNQRFVQ